MAAGLSGSRSKPNRIIFRRSCLSHQMVFSARRRQLGRRQSVRRQHRQAVCRHVRGGLRWRSRTSPVAHILRAAGSVNDAVLLPHQCQPLSPGTMPSVRRDTARKASCGTSPQ